MAHEQQILAEEKARKLIAICRAGFTSEHHWQAWMKKHGPEIEGLPAREREAVMLAWDQATCREFSK